jgi:hypothetical protein
MRTDLPLRLAYAAAAVATMVVGLVVHLGGSSLPVVARDVLGDALWALMLTWWISVVWPRRGIVARGLCALAICYVVEVSQLLHTPALEAVRRTTLGHLVLGSGFDPRDFAAYALGCLAAVVSRRAVTACRGVR